MNQEAEAIAMDGSHDSSKEESRLSHATEARRSGSVVPADCPTCGSLAGGTDPSTNGNDRPSYIYAIGRIEARFPSLAVEKEFAQATARTDTAGKTDQQTFHAVLSKPEHRYLVRQLCWLPIQGLETYLLLLRNPADIDMLVETIHPEDSRDDMDLIIGVRGPIAGPEMCNGLMVPIVFFAPAAEELFNSILLLTDNAGAADEHRAFCPLV